MSDPDYMRTDFSTFIIDNLQFSEGKWYYCVQVQRDAPIQIGLATNGCIMKTLSGI